MEKIPVELLDFGLCPMKEWDVSLSELLQPDLRARIIRCNAQRERFDFFFAFGGQRLTI